MSSLQQRRTERRALPSWRRILGPACIAALGIGITVEAMFNIGRTLGMGVPVFVVLGAGSVVTAYAFLGFLKIHV